MPHSGGSASSCWCLLPACCHLASLGCGFRQRLVVERWGPGRLSHSLFIWAWLWRISSAEKNGFAGEPSGLYPGPLGNVGGRALFGWGKHPPFFFFSSVIKAVCLFYFCCNAQHMGSHFLDRESNPITPCSGSVKS